VFQSAELATHEWLSRTDIAGEAPVAVLVHGITGWHRTWWRVAPAIVARGWRAVGIDLRGHGTSPAIGGSITAAEFALDVEVTLDRLGLRTVDAIVAHSLGAAVTMELARRRPEIARRLVLEDPPGQTRADDVEYQVTLEREVLAARRDPEAEIRRELAENPTWLEEDAHQNVEGRARCDLDGILASLRGNTGVRSVDLAPQLRVPALYLVADEERSVLGERRAELLANLPPVARAIEFASGHTIHRDRTDEYNAAVLQWLENR
jgi:esterase